MLVHAAIGRVGNATPQSFTPTPSAVVLDAQLQARHLATDLVAYSITTPVELSTAKYNIAWEINYMGQAGDSGRFTIAAYKNGSTKIVETERVIDIVDGVIGQVFCNVQGITLAGEDEVNLTIKADGSKDLLIANAQLSVQRLGIE